MIAAPDTMMLALRNGGSLRFRPPHGFYVVLAGQRVLISQGAAKAAVRAGRVRPNGIDQHGVYLFALAK